MRWADLQEKRGESTAVDNLAKLVELVPHPVKGVTSYRMLGGGIEFGETGAEAVARELNEELGATALDVRYLATVENSGAASPTSTIAPRRCSPRGSSPCSAGSG